MIQTFEQKWSEIEKQKKDSAVVSDETSLFVEKGLFPMTQRQLNLYYYFDFIKQIINKSTSIKDVMEIGCGRGTISLYLASYERKKMTLLDTSADAIAIAKDSFQKRGLDATYIVGDALDTKLPDESFDAIVSIGLAEHLDGVTSLFKEQYRLLRKGGVMISLNIPKKKISIQYLNTIFRYIKKVCGTYTELVSKDYYRNEYTSEAYADFAKQVGFYDVSITHVCPFPIYTPLGMTYDKKITKLRNMYLSIRKLWMPYPYKINKYMAQAHFLVGYKK